MAGVEGRSAMPIHEMPAKRILTIVVGRLPHLEQSKNFNVIIDFENLQMQSSMKTRFTLF